MAKKPKILHARAQPDPKKPALGSSSKPSGNILARRGWLLAGAIGIALYLPSARYDFTYDDTLIVRDNPRIRDLKNFKAYLGTSYWNRPGQNKEYRPLTLLGFAINYRFSRGDPAPYHAVNIALHGAVCAAAWWMIMLMFGRAGLATLAALLFAIHPIHVECVAGVVGRAELQSALGFILALAFGRLSFTAPTAGGRWAWAAAAALCAALAFGSKESSVTLLPALGLLPFLPSPGADRSPSPREVFSTPSFVRLLPSVLLCALMLAVYFIFRRVVLGGFFSRPGEITIASFDNPLLDLKGLPRKLTALKLLARYGLMLLAPFHPSPDYSLGAIRLVARFNDPGWIVGGLLIPLSVWIAWRLRARPASLFGIALFLISFILTSNLIFLIGTIMAERLLYFPSLGFCILATDLALWITLNPRRKNLPPSSRRFSPLRITILAALGLWIAALTGQTLRYLPNWQDNRHLYAYAVRRVPGSARAQMLYGRQILDEGRIAEAIEHLETSIAIAPKVPLTLSFLGMAYYAAGRIAEAQKTWERALDIDSGEANSIMGLARLYARQGAWDKADRLYPLAIQREPDNYPLRRDYGIFLAERGRAREAIEYLGPLAPREGVAPDDAQLMLNLGRAHFDLRQFDAAIGFLRRARAADPENPRASLILARALIGAGRPGEARPILLDLDRRSPGNAEARSLLESIGP